MCESRIIHCYLYVHIKNCRLDCQFIRKMTNRWCGGALFCSVLGSIVVYLLLFPFQSTIKVISLPSRKEMLLWFAHSESADCEIYHEFGGVLNRMYKPSPALFFMDGQKSVCLDPVSLAPPVDNCLVYSFGNKLLVIAVLSLSVHNPTLQVTMPNGVLTKRWKVMVVKSSPLIHQ